MSRYPQARDYIEQPRLVTPRTIIDELRRIADGMTDEPATVNERRIAALCAEWMESERKLREQGRG